WLTRHPRAVLEKPRPAQWKLLLGLAAVGISDGVNSQLIEIHHRQVGTDGWLCVGRGHQDGGAQEKQRPADRLHTIRRQPIPVGKGWQESRGLLDATEAILSQ